MLSVNNFIKFILLVPLDLPVIYFDFKKVSKQYVTKSNIFRRIIGYKNSVYLELRKNNLHPLSFSANDDHMAPLMYINIGRLHQLFVIIGIRQFRHGSASQKCQKVSSTFYILFVKKKISLCFLTASIVADA